MKKLLSMVLCAMMALTLAGCGGSGGDSSTYTFSSELDIKNLDSSDADDGCSFTAMHAVIDGLMKTDKKGNIINGVASKMLNGLTVMMLLQMISFMLGIEFSKRKVNITTCSVMVLQVS